MERPSYHTDSQQSPVSLKRFKGWLGPAFVLFTSLSVRATCYFSFLSSSGPLAPSHSFPSTLPLVFLLFPVRGVRQGLSLARTTHTQRKDLLHLSIARSTTPFPLLVSPSSPNKVGIISIDQNGDAGSPRHFFHRHLPRSRPPFLPYPIQESKHCPHLSSALDSPVELLSGNQLYPLEWERHSQVVSVLRYQ